ncbi:MAG: alpha/beta hydrolase-fold protein [Phycisphaerales bacterium]
MRAILRIKMTILILLVVGAGATTTAQSEVPTPRPRTEVVVRFDESLRAEPATGRLILLMSKATRGARHRDPLGAPFWDDPSPIYSIAVEAVKPGDDMRIDDSAVAFPVPLSELDGEYSVRAVLDLDRTTSGFASSEKNLLSMPKRLEFDAQRAQSFFIELAGVGRVPDPEDTDRVKSVRMRSESLSEFHGFDFVLRAGVVLPEGYEDHPERRYAAVYHIPGFGGSHAGAWRHRDDHELDRQVVHIYLNPDGPFGHHLFVNSENNGPVGDALVNELIPHLEERFRLVPKDAGRLLTGHSSGGFTSAWLQVNYPETFGGAWATGPDPVDFRAFQIIDIYTATNAYVNPEGNERSSVVIDGAVVCTIRQENEMEHAIDPDNRSGQQWDSWMACFSPRDERGNPAGLWDAKSGAMSPEVVKFWKKRDLRRVVESRWDELGPLVSQRLRIIVGAEDNFDLHEAVGYLRSSLDELSGWESDAISEADRAGRGYIEIIPGRDHFNLYEDGLAARIKSEMSRHLQSEGLLHHAGESATPTR